MIVSGKVHVNACSFVLVDDETVIVARSRVGGRGVLRLECGGVLCFYSQRACVVENSVG